MASNYIVIANPEATFTFEVEGTTITGTVGHDGSLSYEPNFPYGANISNCTPDGVRQEIEQAVARQREQQARAKRLAEIAKNPEPALTTYLRDGEIFFEKIGVRGIHKTSGDALVIRANGTKETLRRTQVLRPLAGIEQMVLIDLIAAKRDAAAAKPEGLSYTTAESTYRPTLTLTFDTDALVYRYEYEGEQFTAESVHEVRSQVLPRLTKQRIAKDYPYAYSQSSGEVQEVLDPALRFLGSLYKTREEGEAAKAVDAKVAEIDQQIKDLRASYQFDFAVFEETVTTS